MAQRGLQNNVSRRTAIKSVLLATLITRAHAEASIDNTIDDANYLADDDGNRLVDDGGNPLLAR
jgi:hypothetical protein